MNKIKCANCDVELTEKNSFTTNWADIDKYCKGCYKLIECKRCGKKLLPPGIHTCNPSDKL